MLPSKQVVREVRKALNLETMSEKVNAVVENLRMTVTKAHESVTSSVTTSFGSYFAAQQENAPYKDRGKSKQNECQSWPVYNCCMLYGKYISLLIYLKKSLH